MEMLYSFTLTLFSTCLKMAAYWCQLKASDRIYSAQLSAIRKSGMLLVVLLGRLLFQEEISNKLLPVSTMIVGVGLLAGIWLWEASIHLAIWSPSGRNSDSNWRLRVSFLILSTIFVWSIWMHGSATSKLSMLHVSMFCKWAFWSSAISSFEAFECTTQLARHYPCRMKLAPWSSGWWLRNLAVGSRHRVIQIDYICVSKFIAWIVILPTLRLASRNFKAASWFLPVCCRGLDCNKFDGQFITKAIVS